MSDTATVPGLVERRRGDRRRRGAKAAGEVLVLEYDDLALRGAVVSRGADGRMRVAAHRESSVLGLEPALVEVLRGLRSAGIALPARAILLSSQVIAMVVELPVDPARPLPWKQMQEMLRWEIEPYISRNQARRIGAILVGRGFMSDADLNRLLREMEKRGQGETADVRPRRFGELAVEAGLVTKLQLEECLSFQQSLQSFEGGPACGWTPLDAPPRDGRWKWLVAGVAEDCRRQLVEALAGQGLKLAALYPLVGCAAGCVDGNGGGQAGAVLEYHSGFLGCVHFSADGRVVGNRSAFSHQAGLPADECAELCSPDAVRVWLAGRWPDLESAAALLGPSLGRSCAVLPVDVELPPDAKHPAAAFAGAGGATADFLSWPGERRLASVPAQDPLPPLSRNRVFLASLALAAAALLLAAAGVALRRGRSSREALIAAGDRAAALGAQVAAEESGVAATRARIAFLEKTLPGRQTLVPSLLDALESSRRDDIIVQRVIERPGGEVELGGWGLTLQSIQAFRIALQEHLHGWRLADTGKPVRQERGWGGLAGYGFEVVLVESRP